MGCKRSKKPGQRPVKAGFTLTEKTAYQLSVYCSIRRLNQSHLIEQLVTERLRGENLPAKPPGGWPSDESGDSDGCEPGAAA